MGTKERSGFPKRSLNITPTKGHLPILKCAKQVIPNDAGELFEQYQFFGHLSLASKKPATGSLARGGTARNLGVQRQHGAHILTETRMYPNDTVPDAQSLASRSATAFTTSTSTSQVWRR